MPVQNNIVRFTPYKLFRGQSIFLVILLIISWESTAQIGKHRHENTKGLNLSLKAGGSMLITEIYSDFSGAVNEFHHQPGPGFGAELSKYFSGNIEAGTELSFSWLRGGNHAPRFSANGICHYMTEPVTEPVQYTTRLYGPKIFARYHFLPRLKESPVNLYLKAGVGILFYESELFYKYRTENKFIFGKGLGENKTTQVSNVVYILGSGFCYNVGPRVKFITSLNLNFVNYDFLDMVHNYDEAGNRRQITGLFSELNIGITIQLEKSMVPFMRKVKKSYPVKHLPFAR